MKSLIRKSDAPLLSALIPLSLKIPATVITSEPNYLNAVALVPDWFFWVSLGFAAAAWLLDPWRKESRLREWWTALTNSFDIERVVVGNFDDPGDPMPSTDVALRVFIRFRKSGRYKVRLRVFSCTGRGRKPFQHVIPISEITVVHGERMMVPVVDLGVARQGWDHERKRGWGPTKDQSFIGGSYNVVLLECEGRFTQKHRLFVALINHDTGAGVFTPSIYVQSEDDEIWDTTGDARLGDFKYG